MSEVYTEERGFWMQSEIKIMKKMDTHQKKKKGWTPITRKFSYMLWRRFSHQQVIHMGYAMPLKLSHSISS